MFAVRRRGPWAVVAVVAGIAMVACGDRATQSTIGKSATTTATVADRSYTGDITTTDGYTYAVIVQVGVGSATGNPECPATATPGKTFLPVTLTVTNKATDKAAPFPPLRVELTAAAGAKPAQVLVRDPSGACTFTPKVPSIGPGASVAFKGTSPAIDATAAPGTAGRIEVSVSETRFSLVAPVP